jgi:hypothetical protein
MQTFDQHLLEHLQAGRITMEEAMHVATSPHDFKLMVAAESRTPGKLGSPSRAALAAPPREGEAPAPNPVGAGTMEAPVGPPPANPGPPPAPPSFEAAPAPQPVATEPPAPPAYSPPPAPVAPAGPPPSAPPPGF